MVQVVSNGQVVIGGKAREENKPWFRWDFGSVDPIGYESLLGGIIFLNHYAAYGRGVGI